MLKVKIKKFTNHTRINFETFRPQVLTGHVITDILVGKIPDISTAFVTRALLEHLATISNKTRVD